MKKTFKQLLTLALLLMLTTCLVLTGCTSNNVEPVVGEPTATPTPTATTTQEPADPVTIQIIHTNDIHARVIEGDYDGMGFAKMATLIKENEANNPNTLVIDAGDTFHGQTIATLEEGASIVELMNLMGYDYMTAGNHDFNYGYEQLVTLAGEADFDILSANVLKDGAPLLTDSTIIELDGLKVGLFGLTTEETTYKTHPDNVKGLEFANTLETAKATVEKLDAETDVIICIGHIGIDEGTAITSKMICDQIDGIDLFIDGHSHSELADSITCETGSVIVSAGEHTKNLGIVSLTYDNGEVSVESQLINKEATADVAEDADVVALVDSITSEQSKILDEVVGTTDVKLEGERENVRTGETNLGNLIVDAMLNETGADIAFTNGGGIRASIEPGEISKGDVITVLPFGNYIVTTEISGAQLKEALEHGTSDYPETKGAFPHVANITFTINTKAEAGSRIEDLKVSGQDVADTDTFVMATNDFLYAGGDDYAMFTNGIINEYAALDEAVIEYLPLVASMPEVQGKIIVK